MKVRMCMGKYLLNNLYLKGPYSLNHIKHIGRYSTAPQYDIDLKINNISLNKYIKHLLNEYASLNRIKISREVGQRLAELQPIMNLLRERRTVEENLVNLKELFDGDDQEIKSLAKEEKITFENQIKIIDEQLLQSLLPNEEGDASSALVLEVNAGVGGQEAMLFGSELFEMYCNFAQHKGWDVQIADYATTELGGIRHATALINGTEAFRFFKYEVGVHRVQRIPVTEKAGRVHTSTVSVLALPQPNDIEIDVQNKDLRIETKKASGAGGQHVNTTDSAVRITHIPTGTSVECQVDRSQIKNKAMAMQTLRAKLYQQKLDAQLAQIEATKKSQVRTNFRNEKIRTYNFSQDRITDHRLRNANVHNLKGFLMGGEQLEHLMEKLHYTLRVESLLQVVHDLEIKK